MELIALLRTPLCPLVPEGHSRIAQRFSVGIDTKVAQSRRDG
jgi:hypothetical protein